MGAAYCLLPVVWVIAAATKSGRSSSRPPRFAPSTHLLDNIGDLTTYRDGLFWRWMANTVLYAGVGAAALDDRVRAWRATASRSSGSAASRSLFSLILAGVLVPGVILAVPQFLLVATAGLRRHLLGGADPEHHQPVRHLPRPDLRSRRRCPTSCSRPAAWTVPREAQLFVRIALPIMRAGLVTIFLFQFVAIWNNFMLPYIMLGNDRAVPA